MKSFKILSSIHLIALCFISLHADQPKKKMPLHYTAEVEKRIKHDKETRHTYGKNAHFIQYALTQSGAGQYVRSVVFTHDVREYGLSALESLPPQITVYINPAWFNSLSPVAQWKSVTDIIVELDREYNEPTRCALQNLAR